MDVSGVGQNAADGFLDVGVEVDGVDDGDFGVARGDLMESEADVFKAFAEVFPPVAGDQNEFLAGEDLFEGGEAAGKVTGYGFFHPFAADGFQGQEEGVDDGVSGDVDVVRVDSFVEEILARPLGRGEVQVGDDARDPAVDLLREGGTLVSGTQAGFDVPHGDVEVEGGE